MPTPVLNNIEVFKTTVQVMLEDGVLTREEKRLVIKLSNRLERALNFLREEKFQRMKQERFS